MIALNSAWNLVNFRSGLIQALVARGYEVVAVAPSDKYAGGLAALGCRYIALSMDSKGIHPGRDLVLLMRFFNLIRAERPDVFLGYTVKPNVYGSVASHMLGIPVINNVAGLGAAFSRSGWLNKLVRSLYVIALSRSAKVFFQNKEDCEKFLSEGIVSPNVCDKLPGSGIDLLRFVPREQPSRLPIRFLLVGRMLWEKGVGEFVTAARLLGRRGISAEFCLLGFLDESDRTAISRSQIDDWVAERVVRYLGVSDDVREEMAQADCIVLPSYYREGTPRTLLEAAAISRPIVTTDSVGCRNVVENGVNGYLCKPRDAVDLADKMERILGLSRERRAEMGLRGREKVEKEFDEKIVVRKYLDAIESIIAANRQY